MAIFLVSKREAPGVPWRNSPFFNNGKFGIVKTLQTGGLQAKVIISLTNPLSWAMLG
jgi:hypothetical protein